MKKGGVVVVSRKLALNELFRWIWKNIFLPKLRTSGKRLKIVRVERFNRQKGTIYGFATMGDKYDVIAINNKFTGNSEEDVRTIIHELAHIIFESVQWITIFHTRIYDFEGIFLHCLTQKEKCKLLSYIPSKTISWKEYQKIHAQAFYKSR